VLLDVRTPEEFASGHLQGALNLPYDQITADVVTQIPDKTATIQVYCRSGRRSAIAVETLKTLGYTDLQDLGGLSDAQAVLKLPIEP
jgi:phage shock protein E